MLLNIVPGLFLFFIEVNMHEAQIINLTSGACGSVNTKQSSDGPFMPLLHSKQHTLGLICVCGDLSDTGTGVGVGGRIIGAESSQMESNDHLTLNIVGS